MKKILFLTTIVLFSFVAFGQVQTTQEEYNYCTKGLKAQYANGLDTKKGYTIELYEKIPAGKDSQTNKDRFLFYYLLKRDIDKKTAAIVLMIGNDVSSSSTVFFCIPAFDSDSEIWKQYFASLTAAGSCPMYPALILQCSSIVLSKALTSE